MSVCPGGWGLGEAPSRKKSHSNSGLNKIKGAWIIEDFGENSEHTNPELLMCFSHIKRLKVGF